MTKQIVHIVYQIREDHPTMGIRDIYYKVRPTGIGRDYFEEICRAEGLMISRPVNWTKTTDSRGVIRFEDLTKGLTIRSVNQLWQSDITYFELGGRFYYLTFIQDTYSKRILGYSVSKTLQTEQTTLPALTMAVRNRKGMDISGVILHSDGGGQYYSGNFLSYTKKKGILNSMCQYPWDNGMAERLNGVIKNNYLKHYSIRGYNQLVKKVDRVVSLYNHDKPHRKLKRNTPIGFEIKFCNLVLTNKAEGDGVIRCKTSIGRGIEPLRLKQTKPQDLDVISAKMT
jgi:transposase InsO family protein